MRKQPLVTGGTWNVSSHHCSSSDKGADTFITAHVFQVDHTPGLVLSEMITRHPVYDGLVVAAPEGTPFTWEMLDDLKDQLDAILLDAGLLKPYVRS